MFQNGLVCVLKDQEAKATTLLSDVTVPVLLSSELCVPARGSR